MNAKHPVTDPMAASLFRSSSRISLCLALALLAGGCLRSGPSDVTGSVSPTTLSAEQWREQADLWAKRYDASPGDRAASLNYSRALRAIGQRDQAVAVLEQAAARAPNDLEVLGAFGRALADAGKLREALGVLDRAHTPDRPNWRILSAQGVVADKLGEHPQAQRYYESALALAPDEPSVMSNLGFSYALARRLPDAEKTLRTAVQSPRADRRMRQNLVLVLGLQGKFAEAEELARADLPPEEASQNVAYLRRLVSQPNNWAKIKESIQR